MTIIPFDDRDGWIWMDGTMVPWREAKLHVLSHGLHYGSSVFEGERAYNGKIFKSIEHSERFKRSAELVGFTIDMSVEEMEVAKYTVLEKNNLKDAYVRPIAWRGSEMMAISAQATKTHVAIAVWEWPNVFGKNILETGMRVTVSDWRRPDPKTIPSASKAAGLYMICTMSKHDAENKGFHDALMLDYRGYVAEGTGANVFLVMDGKIHTPTPDCFLDGITRRTVIKLACDSGYDVIERHIKPEEISDASEMFFTGTAAEVKPIACVDDHLFEVGPITKELIEKYQALVRG